MPARLNAATFCIDITPPVGTFLAYVPNDKVDSPIYIRGMVLDDGSHRAVWVTADVIYFWGKAYRQIRRVIANAAGTTPGKVFLHAVHQHDSMRFTVEMNEFYRQFGLECIPPDYYRAVLDNLSETISRTVNTTRAWKRVVRVAVAERRISGLASNRRMIDEHNTCYAMRFSMCPDTRLQAKPVGRIDPLLRTVAMYSRGDRLIAAMHFYASHPMGAYRRNMVGADVPGVAMEYVTRHTGTDGLHMYFNGCGGNITFGKYYRGREKTIALLGERLGRALVKNMACLEDRDIGPMTFRNARFTVPLKREINEKSLRRQMQPTDDLEKLFYQYFRPAMLLVIARNWPGWSQATVSRMSIGDGVHFLSLPGETVVEYQLYAQSLVPEQFLATAAYGDCTYHYIPTDDMYDQGGYEPVFGAICTRQVEPVYNRAIEKVLKPLL